MTVDNSEFIGNKYGIYTNRDMASVTPKGGFFGLDVTDSTFDNQWYASLYFEGLSDATLDNLEITNTGGLDPVLPFGGRGIFFNIKRGTFSDVAITNSSITDSVNDAVAVQVRGFPGDSASYQPPNNAILNNFTATGNTITGNGGPGFNIWNYNGVTTGGTWQINNNRIVGNGFEAPSVTLPVNGLYAWDTLDATDNWWGCNEGPLTGGPDCDTVSSTPVPPFNLGVVDADPWLVLTATATPPGPTLVPG